MLIHHQPREHSNVVTGSHARLPAFFILVAFLLAACTSPSASPEIPVSSTLASALPSQTVSPGTPTAPAQPTANPPTASPPAGPPLASPRPAQTVQPSATPVEEVCQEDQGRIEQKQAPTDLLPDPLDFRIYLPPCYGDEARARYPVLYLIHGLGYHDDQWDRLGADETASALIVSGEIPPFIIVMPHERTKRQPYENKFGQAIVEALIPWVDRNYATLPERRYRAVGGLSRGGGWALHLGLSQWELFGAFGAHSLGMFSTDSSRIPAWLDSIPADQMPRIYLDMDDRDRRDLIESAAWFENLLTERGILHEWYLYPGYHEEKYWSAHVEQYLRWYAAGWVE